MNNFELPAGVGEEGLPGYIIDALQKADFSARKYQEIASLEALRILKNGMNAEINLPPGTGKTLISQIIGSIWIRESDPSVGKVLCVVPTSALREQHYHYSWWAEYSNLCRPLELSAERLKRKGSAHREFFLEKNFWFALPESFCNAYELGYIPYKALASVGLVIIDEYDAFSIRILKFEGYKLRFSKDYERLMGALNQKNRQYLLMSATPAHSVE